MGKWELFQVVRFIAIRLLAVLMMTLPSAVLAAAQTPPEPDRLIVIGDAHGDFDRYKSILREAGLIDARQNWIGGSTELVQLGDVTDRGPDSRKIIELLMSLETKSKRRGGAVHFVLGNHEAMNVSGDLRYVHPGEYAAFQTSKSERVRDKYFESYKDYVIANSADGELQVFDAAYREKWNKQFPLGYVEHRTAWSVDGKYGSWALEHDAVLKLGKFLFLHGGIGPKYAGLSISEINGLVHEDLDGDPNNDSGITTASDGPLWYRGLAENSDEVELAHLDALLARHGVEHIFIGHTPLTEAIIPRFGRKVIVADVGLAAAYGGANAYIEIVGGEIYAIHRGQRLALPMSGGDAFFNYLETARALEDDPDRIISYMEELLPSE
jgi:hypothetical protein